MEFADLAALTLYLTPQESLVRALGKLAEHTEAASQSKFGIPYFDEWKHSDDLFFEETPVVWTYRYREETCNLLELGYFIGKSQPSAHWAPKVYVTILVSKGQS